MKQAEMDNNVAQGQLDARQKMYDANIKAAALLAGHAQTMAGVDSAHTQAMTNMAAQHHQAMTGARGQGRADGCWRSEWRCRPFSPGPRRRGGPRRYGGRRRQESRASGQNDRGDVEHPDLDSLRPRPPNREPKRQENNGIGRRSSRTRGQAKMVLESPTRPRADGLISANAGSAS